MRGRRSISVCRVKENNFQFIDHHTSPRMLAWRVSILDVVENDGGMMLNVNDFQRHKRQLNELDVQDSNHRIDDWTMSFSIDSTDQPRERGGKWFEIQRTNEKEYRRLFPHLSNEINRATSLSDRDKEILHRIFLSSKDDDSLFFSEWIGDDGNYLMKNDSWHSSRDIFLSSRLIWWIEMTQCPFSGDVFFN